MCGRFTLTATPEEVAAILGLTEIEPFPPRYNIAPTQPVIVVVGGARERPEGRLAGRGAQLARWGLIPSWVKEVAGFPLLFNARSETAAEKNAFRAAMRYRRCLVPASGFYEWQRMGTRKSQAFFLRPRSHGLILFAGLLECWHAPDGSEIDTVAILTTRANDTMAAIHERMPVVVGAADIGRWLDCRSNDPEAVADLLAPVDDDFFEAIPVSDKVNRVANMGPDVQHPVAAAVRAEKGDRSAALPVQPSLF